MLQVTLKLSPGAAKLTDGDTKTVGVDEVIAAGTTFNSVVPRRKKKNNRVRFVFIVGTP